MESSPENCGIKSLVESLLFVSGEPLSLSQMGRILGVSGPVLEPVLASLAEEYQARGFRLQRQGDQVQMVTAPEAAPYVERLLVMEGRGQLSRAALETLAIIAYRQPMTRAGIEAVRGVNSDRALDSLEARGLVAEVGRLPTVGRPVLFGTTLQFLEHFGLESLEQLPPLAEEKGIQEDIP